MNVELLDEVSTEIAEYSATEAGLADLRERMANVEYDVSTIKGMAVAKADRAEVRGLRTGLENMRKSIKAPALAHCKLIDDEAKRITAALLEIEEPIDAQIKAREAVLESERAARELAERERVTAIHQRIADIREYVALALACRTSERIQAIQDRLAGMDASGFDEFTDEAMAALQATGKRVEEILTEKLASEAETARVRAEQAAAAAQLVKERAELAAARAEQEAIAIAEAARLAAERKAQEDEDAARRAIFMKEMQDLADAKAAFEQTQRVAQEAADLAAYQAAVTQEPEVAPSVDADDDIVDAEVIAPLVLSGELVTVPMAVPMLPVRPTDRAMVQAVAAFFDVDYITALAWMETIDFHELNR